MIYGSLEAYRQEISFFEVFFLSPTEGGMKHHPMPTVLSKYVKKACGASKKCPMMMIYGSLEAYRQDNSFFEEFYFHPHLPPSGGSKYHQNALFYQNMSKRPVAHPKIVQ